MIVRLSGLWEFGFAVLIESNSEEMKLITLVYAGQLRKECSSVSIIVYLEVIARTALVTGKDNFDELITYCRNLNIFCK